MIACVVCVVIPTPANPPPTQPFPRWEAIAPWPSLDIHVQPVPAPGMAVVFGLAVLWLARRK